MFSWVGSQFDGVLNTYVLGDHVEILVFQHHAQRQAHIGVVLD